MTDVTAPESVPAPEPDEAVVTPTPMWRRVVRRVMRRPTEWLMSPWPAERMARYVTALVLVGGATFAVLQVVHLDLLLADNTPTGGDMGAHVMGPAYLRDHLLPNFQIAGWSNYWYNGFPLYRFYMVIPALLIVALNVVLPYGIAFKIVTVLGILTLPFCAWCFGRLARFRFPIPELMALAALAFLMDESFSIYGGNIKSTMAGEFSFSIALSLGILGLGLLARGLETGKYRNWTAIVLALSMLSHGIVLIFVVLGALLLWLIWLDKSRAVYGVTMGVTAVLLSAFWVLPFLFNHAYMTDMKYGFRPNGTEDSFWDMFFPWPTFYDILVSGFALVGFVSSIVKRNLTGAWMGILCLALMGATFLARESLPVIGLLWNPRLLPFLYLVRLMLMMVGIVDTVAFVAKGVRGAEWAMHRDWIVGTVTAGIVFVGVMGSELFLYREMPGGRMASKNGESVYTWGIGGWDPITLSATSKDALADGWTRYNFGGYEGRPAYGEYKALVDAMAAIGEERGCGRALWENNKDTGAYGTTMALMLLPHWTDGCIASQEGLFFEASGSTPYHFLSAAAMSEKSSNPVRELRYTDNDASVGVPMLQKLGVKYVMVFTDAAREEASANGDLTLVDQVGPWNIYEVADADLVVPLAVEPVVVAPRPGDQRERNLELGTSWFQNTDEWAAMPADDGPAGWQRIEVQVDTTRRVGSAPGEPGRKVDIVVPQGTITPRALPAIEVTDVVVGEQDLRFEVSQTGVPVLVKISYFPNWKVEGAEGPYRVAPNFMVVVPTEKVVRFEYTSSGIDKGAWVLTLVGIGLLFLWRRRGDVVHATAHPYLVDDWTDDAADDRADAPAAPGSDDPLTPEGAGDDPGSPRGSAAATGASADTASAAAGPDGADVGSGADPTPPAGSL